MDIFRVDVDQDDGAVPRLRLIGEMDAGTIDVFRTAIIDVSVAGVTRVVLDLGELDFIDSTGLGGLVGALKRFRDLDGDLALANVRPRVAKLLELTGLDKAFTIT